MSLTIKNNATQLLNYIKIQITFIVRFIANEVYPTIKNTVTRLFNDPNARTVLCLAILLIVILAFGIGDDHGT